MPAGGSAIVLVTQWCQLFGTPGVLTNMLLCAWNSPARILEWVAIPFSGGIFQTQETNLGLLHCRQILYHLSHQGSPL